MSSITCPMCGAGVTDRGSEELNRQVLATHILETHKDAFEQAVATGDITSFAGRAEQALSPRAETWNDGMDSAIREVEFLMSLYCGRATTDVLIKPLDQIEHERKFFRAYEALHSILVQRKKEHT